MSDEQTVETLEATDFRTYEIPKICTDEDQEDLDLEEISTDNWVG